MKTLGLIPLPQEFKQSDDNFVLTSQTKVVSLNENFRPEVDLLLDIIKKRFDLDLSVVRIVPSDGNYIIITQPESETGKPEDYDLYVNQNQILFSAEGQQGLYYAIQTLTQLMPLEKSTELKIPCVQIQDSPSYKWRGMHLDCSRHFFTKDEVKRYIDYLAMYKFNVFHWHLTDDQGWRIEIKKYPLLTTIGSKRKATIIGKQTWEKDGTPSKNEKYDSTAYGGFYTQEEIKEVVAYAKSKYITIVPEIEMPGHALAALASYPQYSCTGGPFETYTKWGVSDDVLCAGNDETFIFLENILTEVMELFPGKYIHIGGDECVKVRWKACLKCQKRIADEKLKNEDELQSYFITRVEKFVNSKGRQVIGWDEILEGGLAPNAAVMSWRGIKGGIAAAKQKHNVVMSPGKPCYFDHYQSKDKAKEPLAIGGFNPLDSVYAYDPTLKVLAADDKKYIMGAQGNVWTEYILDFSSVEYMSMPRMAALSEVLWTKPDKKNYKNFVERLKVHSKLLDKMHVNYAKHFFKIK
ncbi:MAG: beta-N-acetylhexosaminidase [Bacteroidetes bacterium]|nr:beta-N-acetylhexosaminidase [Bacteroidota bacterium]